MDLTALAIDDHLIVVHFQRGVFDIEGDPGPMVIMLSYITIGRSD